jgi:hypothetical protein
MLFSLKKGAHAELASSTVLARCGSKNVDPGELMPWGSFGVRVVESHISPKTGEIWGTRRLWWGKRESDKIVLSFLGFL